MKGAVPPPVADLRSNPRHARGRYWRFPVRAVSSRPLSASALEADRSPRNNIPRARCKKKSSLVRHSDRNTYRKTMDTQDFSGIHAICETGRFRKATLNLGISQPTLSARIARLEDALGARLFERRRGRSIPSVRHSASSSGWPEVISTWRSARPRAWANIPAWMQSRFSKTISSSLRRRSIR
jgi:DNA-binding transcriptional ArsR family regulator